MYYAQDHLSQQPAEQYIYQEGETKWLRKYSVHSILRENFGTHNGSTKRPKPHIMNNKNLMNMAEHNKLIKNENPLFSHLNPIEHRPQAPVGKIHGKWDK